MSQLKIKNGNSWENIPAGGVGVPSGGNSGDVLVKNNSADFATQWRSLIDLIYPVGSIYMSTSSVSPGTFLGGSWTRIKDKFLLSAGDTYTAGDTGGEATHTLTTTEMPSHSHRYAQYVGSVGWSQNSPWNVLKSSGDDGYTNTNPSGYMATISSGSGAAHNNMPPYLTVYVWERTA